MMIVNDDSRVVNKLEASLTDGARVIIYDHCMFIVAAIGVPLPLNIALPVKHEVILFFLFSSRALVNESLVTVFHSHLRHIEQAVSIFEYLGGGGGEEIKG
jgi:hypothetical protein